MIIALKQCPVTQRRGVAVSHSVVAMGGDDRADLDDTAPTAHRVDATAKGEQRLAADVGDHAQEVKPGGLPEIYPFQRHPRGIGPQDLLCQYGHRLALMR